MIVGPVLLGVKSHLTKILYTRVFSSTALLNNACEGGVSVLREEICKWLQALCGKAWSHLRFDLTVLGGAVETPLGYRLAKAERPG